MLSRLKKNYANYLLKPVVALGIIPARKLPGIQLQLQLTLLMSLLTLTGFVCTNKAHPGEECLSNSNVLCFECDSRYDPNCADPFDFSPTATLDTSSMISMIAIMKTNKATTSNNETGNPTDHQSQQAADSLPTDRAAVGSNSTANIKRQPKQLPKALVCHGCCVKITSRMPDGGVYVKRTCTSNLQINYFMVGLVCMKESGDRGKMCFCETDYCNGQASIHQYHHLGRWILLLISVALSASIALVPLKTTNQLGQES